MEYFKILTHNKKNVEYLSGIIDCNKLLVSKSGEAFGIKYDPNEYSKLLKNKDVINLFIKKSVKQLLMNNWRYEELLNFSTKLQLNLVDCTLKDIKLYKILDDEELNIDTLHEYIFDKDIEITKMKFRTLSRGKYLIIIMNNGVIGVDEELLIEKCSIVPKLLDFVSYGRMY